MQTTARKHVLTYLCFTYTRSSSFQHTWSRRGMWTGRVGVHYAKDTHQRPHILPPHHPSGKKMEFFRRGNWTPNFRLFQELSVAAGCEDSFSICLSLIGRTSTGSLPWLAKSPSFKTCALWLVVTEKRGFPLHVDKNFLLPDFARVLTEEQTGYPSLSAPKQLPNHRGTGDLPSHGSEEYKYWSKQWILLFWQWFVHWCWALSATPRLLIGSQFLQVCNV